MRRILVLVLTACGSVMAANLAGKWQYTYTSPNGIQREGVIELITTDGKVSGSISSDRGKAMIDDGTVQGDDIAFRLIRKGNGDEIVVKYQGKLQGDRLQLTMQYGTHEPVSITGKRMP